MLLKIPERIQPIPTQSPPTKIINLRENLLIYLPEIAIKRAKKNKKSI
jgi:hypothetical protein